MTVHVPSLPRRWQVTQGMLEDFLCDPVLAAHCLLGVSLDYFQENRLRYYWWVPNLVDSSGFSSGKTIVDWVYIQLRCLLLAEHSAGVYYPTFETMKSTFWPYYSTCRAPMYLAHIGRLDETGEDAGTSRTQGAACYKAYYKNGSDVKMPAPSFMRQAFTQASFRFNTVLVEEWTHIDASSQGINDQLIGRVTKRSWNQHHPVWSNHITMTAPAKTQMHPGWRRYRMHEREQRRGDPRYAVISYSYKDYSSRLQPSGRTFREDYRVQSTIDRLKRESAGDPANFLSEGLGIWSQSGRGWFSEETLMSCVDAGRRAGIVPEEAAA